MPNAIEDLECRATKYDCLPDWISFMTTTTKIVLTLTVIAIATGKGAA
jgi:hypothetical protein